MSKSSDGTMLRTFGPKPIKFQLEEGGEWYMIGSEVGVKSISEILIFQEN